RIGTGIELQNAVLNEAFVREPLNGISRDPELLNKATLSIRVPRRAIAYTREEGPGALQLFPIAFRFRSGAGDRRRGRGVLSFPAQPRQPAEREQPRPSDDGGHKSYGNGEFYLSEEHGSQPSLGEGRGGRQRSADRGRLPRQERQRRPERGCNQPG